MCGGQGKWVQPTGQRVVRGVQEQRVQSSEQRAMCEVQGQRTALMKVRNVV